MTTPKAELAKICTDKDVRKFLSDKRSGYEKLLEYLDNYVLEFTKTPKGKEIIHSFYSRSKKQNKRAFKDIWKICEKVNKKRFGSTRWSKTPPPKDEEIHPKFKIYQVEDIIAMTVVVVYISDILEVRSFIDTLIEKKNLKSHANESSEYYGETKEYDGYYAFHYQLGYPDPLCLNLRCELQIKTALHDAFGAKTHDLTYKPQGELDERMQQQIHVLGDTLQAIERQSELLKSLIRERWLLDEKRKKLARAQILLELPLTTNKEKAEKYMSIKTHIEKNMDSLKDSEIDDVMITDIIGNIDEMAEGNEHDQDTCRLITLLASINEAPALFDIALSRIEDWYRSHDEAYERNKALYFKSLAHFCFGQVIEAVSTAEEALSGYEEKIFTKNLLEGELKDRKTRLMAGKSGLAYYYAELAGSDAGGKMSAEQRARALIKESQKLANELGITHAKTGVLLELKCMLDDTRGAVKIAFGKSAAEVHKGLTLCTKANDEIQQMGSAHSGLFADFFALHRRRAYQRILLYEE